MYEVVNKEEKKSKEENKETLSIDTTKYKYSIPLDSDTEDD